MLSNLALIIYETRRGCDGRWVHGLRTTCFLDRTMRFLDRTDEQIRSYDDGFRWRLVRPENITYNNPAFIIRHIPKSLSIKVVHKILTTLERRPNTMNNKLTTYSLTDAKLRRLLSWYREQKQKGKGDILPIHQQYLDLSLSQLRMVDISKMRYLEKIGWIKLLGAAEKKWRKYNKLLDNKQQPITKFFKHSPKPKPKPKPSSATWTSQAPKLCSTTTDS